MRSFVIGNGRSRANVSLESLRKHGKIYGCNALYRDFDPDYLVAVDEKMLQEISNSQYHQTHEVWTHDKSKYYKFTGVNFIKPSLGWSSGPTALYLASKHAPTDVYLLGFDFVGINGCINNLYADTSNYKLSTDSATFYGNWQNQTEQVIKANPQINYFRVVNDNYYSLEGKYQNFKEILYQDFYSLQAVW